MTRSALAVLALVVPLSACYVDGDCTPTKVAAKRADKVNVSALSRSAVIEATLTTDGKPLSGLELTFDVLDDDASVYTDDGRTGGEGAARVDLKRADPTVLLALVRADAFRASFTGNGTYCASTDKATFSAVRT